MTYVSKIYSFIVALVLEVTKIFKFNSNENDKRRENDTMLQTLIVGIRNLRTKSMESTSVYEKNEQMLNRKEMAHNYEEALNKVRQYSNSSISPF